MAYAGKRNIDSGMTDSTSVIMYGHKKLKILQSDALHPDLKSERKEIKPCKLKRK